MISRLLFLEGNRMRLDGGAMFGNAPKALWQKWFVPDESNRIGLACRSMLLQTDEGRNVLFEAGIGAFLEPKMQERYGVTGPGHVLLDSLKKWGLQPEDIDQVILSHLHFDHAGGLLPPWGQSQDQLLFSNAKHYVGLSHWKRALNPHPREQASFIPPLHKLLEESGRLVLIEKETHPDLPFISRFYLSNGHTIGLLAAELELPSGPLVFAADIFPGLPWVHLPVTMGYDRYPELLVDEKMQLLQGLVERKGSLFFTHDPIYPLVTVHQGPEGKFFGSKIDIVGDQIF